MAGDDAGKGDGFFDFRLREFWGLVLHLRELRCERQGEVRVGLKLMVGFWLYTFLGRGQKVGVDEEGKETVSEQESEAKMARVILKGNGEGEKIYAWEAAGMGMRMEAWNEGMWGKKKE